MNNVEFLHFRFKK